jgi:hypothetical protein
MSERKKRILLLTIQPPGGSGVQGLIFTKLCKYLQESEWEFHFAGPSPALSSVLHGKTNFPADVATIERYQNKLLQKQPQKTLKPNKCSHRKRNNSPTTSFASLLRITLPHQFSLTVC